MRRGLLLLMLAGCTAAEPEFTASHRAAIVDSVEATLDAFSAAVATMDADSIAAFYAADSAFRWIEDGSVRYRSRDDIATALREAAPFMRNVVLLYDGTVVTPLAPGVASLVTGFAQRFTNPAGETGGFAGAITAVMVHREGRWQFLSGHTSSLARGRGADDQPQ